MIETYHLTTPSNTLPTVAGPRCRSAVYGKRYMYIQIFIITILIVSSVANAAPEVDHDAACLKYIRANDENYKHAHENAECLKAAELGKTGALYHVGMGYGFAGDHDKELAYYRKAANLQNISAYIAMGHVLSRNKETSYEAIYWYQRYIYAPTKKDDYFIGLAANSISSIFTSLGDKQQAQYWLGYCQKYSDKCE